MIKNQLFTLAILLYAALVGCGNDDKEIETKLNEEVMVVHNEVMPKMGEASRLKRQLATFKQTVPDENAALKDSLINTILLLAKSEDMMSDWMANYKYPNPAVFLSLQVYHQILMFGSRIGVFIICHPITHHIF